MTVVGERTELGVWVGVAHVDQLEQGRGVAARVAGVQIALFRVFDPQAGVDEFFAVDNRDPFSDANVLSRGIVGDAAGEPKVASPIYKNCFSLRTGQCLDDSTVSIRVYDIRIVDAAVEIRVP